MKRELIALDVGGSPLQIAALSRTGRRASILFLHGFGSTKEDYADIACQARFDGRAVLAYDAPGCGESGGADPAQISIPFLCSTAESLSTLFNLPRFHLVGHSMGGLTALLLAHARRDAVLSFTNIEGNLAPDDCFFSRSIFDDDADTPDEFLSAFVSRTSSAEQFSYPLYASGLRHKVRAEAVAPLFRSIVELSERGDLLEKFIALPCPKMFIYGDANRSLPYLQTLRDNGVQLAEIPFSDHFPMYANPPAMWKCIGDFVEQSERERRA